MTPQRPAQEASPPWRPRIGALALIALMTVSMMAITPAAAQNPIESFSQESTAVEADAATTNVTESPVDPQEALPGFSFMTMASSSTLFADDFNDNSLDPTKWTVLNNGYDVSETTNRLELTVREQMENFAAVRSSSVTATFSSSAGIDASVDAARHVAGSGFVGKPEFRIVHGSDPTKWVSIQMEVWQNTVWLKDSSGTKEILFSGSPTGFHDYRLEIKGDEYTGHFDTASKTKVSSLFSSAAAFSVDLRYHTGGSSSGLTDTGAFDNVLVTDLGGGSVAQDPTACFSATPTSGSPGTTVSVDASCSSDLQDATSALQVRWDWESDGTYDTPWTTTKTDDSPSFSSSSTIRLQVKDTDGNTDTDTETITITGPPSAPQNMDAECDTPHGTLLSWQAPADNGGSSVTSYKIYGDTSSDPTTVIDTVSASQTSYEHMPSWTSSNWYYRVSAVNSNGESSKSSEVFWPPCDLQDPSEPAAQSWSWTDSIPTLSGAAWQDTYSGLDDNAEYRVDANGVEVVAWTPMTSQPTAGQTTPWDPTWSPSTLAEGTNIVSMRVLDQAGNEVVTEAYVVEYDTQAPDAIATAGILLDDFNDGSVDTTKWSVSGGAENSDCGSQSSPNALKFSASGTRSATTKSLNVGGGGSVAFYLKIGTGSSPCENADSGEDVALEYSTDGGSSWTGIATYDSEAFGSFTLVSEAIPAAAQTSATQFRWRQVSHSGSGFDAWAIDDVNIDTTGISPDAIVTDWVKTIPTLSGMCFLDPHSGLESNAEYWVGSSAGGSDVVGVTTLSSQPSSGQSTTWCPSFQPADLDEGTNYVTLGVEDVLGHANEVDAYEVRFDSVADAVAGLVAKTGSGGSLIAQDTWQTDNTPRFEWTEPSSTSPIVGYSYALTTGGANPDNTVDTTNEFFDASTLSDGTWFFKVKAKDEAGNWGNVASFKLKVDTVDAVFTSLASTTHTDPDEFYSRESATVTWSASDASSGVKEYHYEVVDGACPSSLASPTTTTSTSATEPVPGAFKKYRFCIEAEDEAGNVGGIQSLNLFVDTAKPVYTHVFPEENEEFSDPLIPIEIRYNDKDGGADDPFFGPPDTIVDVDSVEFFVDGVNIPETWGEFCAPGGLFYPTGCRLEVTAGGITYEPLLPWEEGRHEIDVSITDTVAEGGNTATLSTSFFLQCTGSTDSDCDHVNDEVEEELCTRAVFSEILVPETEEELGHSCDDEDNDYRPITATFIVPTGVQEGPDADGDGAPQYVRIQQTAITVDLESAGLIGTSSAPDIVVDVDDGATGDDADPNVPVQSIIASPFPVPTGYEVGEDSDGDGVPRFVDVEMSTVVFDRRNLLNPVSFEEENPSTFFLDDPQGVGDDQDPQSPAASVVAVPVKVPYDIEVGSDQDNDKVPEYVEVKYRTYTFDRRETLDPVSFEEAPSEFHTLDEDDSDPDVPAQSAFTVPVPTGAHHSSDGDDDYVPGSATVEFMDVTVNRADPGVVSFSTHSETHVLDEDDGDRDNVVPFSLVDADNDAVPDELEFPICLVEDQDDPVDGSCTSDLSDYTPPDGRLYPNPWSMV